MHWHLQHSRLEWEEGVSLHFKAPSSQHVQQPHVTSQKKGGLRVANDAVWGVLRPVLRDSISCQLALGLVFSGNLVQRRCG